jgi:hypothetical protein
MTPAEKKRLEKATEAARTAQEKADAALAKRDDLATDLADAGATYQELADAMGITVDGVTYVLRKVRRARAAEAVLSGARITPS